MKEAQISQSVPWMLLDAHRARTRGPTAIAQRQRSRLADIVNFARANSPYYCELYQNLPEHVENVTLLPVTSKKELMVRFDDWATDREVTIEKARTFVDNPEMIGAKFLHKYTIVTTSGTTGTRGIFLMDDRQFSVVKVLMLRMLSAWLGVADIFRILLRGWRMANVAALGGHFATAVAAAQHPKTIQAFSVHMPLPELVDKLNQFRPVIFGGYASTITLLAGEQAAGRLRINPVLVLPIAEGLTAKEYDRVADAFNAKVRTSYAASECPFLSYSCEHGWLHLNSDWVIAEPVDADHRPVPPGVQSHTVLITNLANRVQPILRYDLGDSVLLRPDPCPCGNLLPAIRVQGRTADVLTFLRGRGEEIRIAPLAFSTLLDRTPGIELFQIVQSAPTTLQVRLRLANRVDGDRVWTAVKSEIMRLLAEHQLSHVTVERSQEPPEQSIGGKYREVIPLGRQ